MKLPVPYYSQWNDVKDPYWMPRGCAMTCVKMVLDYYHKAAPSLDELLATGKQEGGYHEINGWVHDYEVELLKKYGLNAFRKEKLDSQKGILELSAALEAGNPVIVSVIDFLLERKRFHQVVLVGQEKSIFGNIQGFYYHDPASSSTTRGAFLYCPIKYFVPAWRQMAIFSSVPGQ